MHSHPTTIRKREQHLRPTISLDTTEATRFSSLDSANDISTQSSSQIDWLNAWSPNRYRATLRRRLAGFVASIPTLVTRSLRVMFGITLSWKLVSISLQSSSKVLLGAGESKAWMRDAGCSDDCVFLLLEDDVVFFCFAPDLSP